MSDLDVWILRSNMELKHKSIDPADNHFHEGGANKSYANITGSGFKDPTGKESPWLIYQENNCIPFGCQRADDDLEEILHTIPTMKALATLYGGGSSIDWGKYLNMKTIPFIVIGVIILYYFVQGNASQAVQVIENVRP